MKAAVLTGLRQMKIADMPKPIIESESDVFLKVAAVGICGSDVHYYLKGRIGSQVVKYPFIVGHECSAVVEAVGRKVRRVRPGDEVAVEPAISCHKCRQCKTGRENTCVNLKFLGTPGQAPGCLCEYIVMPEECCVSTRGRITPEEAALCEPLAIGVYTIKQSKLTCGEKIAILGAGPIGLSCMVAAKLQKSGTIYATDKLDYRAEFAKKTGAKWSGNPDREDIVEEIMERERFGVDVACECAGEQETLDEAVEILRPGGRLMVVGIPRFDRVSFAVDKIRRKEITIINVRRQNRCTTRTVRLIAGRRAKVDSFVTHRFELEQAQDALELVADYRDGVIKAMIKL
jgi:L-iditol 2-dehydrogenase